MPLTITTAGWRARLREVTIRRRFSRSPTRGASKWTMTNGTLPPGLQLSSTGVISGTPTTPGNYAFTVSLDGFQRPTDVAGAVDSINPTDAGGL